MAPLLDLHGTAATAALSLFPAISSMAAISSPAAPICSLLSAANCVLDTFLSMSSTTGRNWGQLSAELRQESPQGSTGCTTN
ncbi:GH24484 [Drosophila grimshawi]|uniref:GH24484 n=1 Tax=Drosophila grimshawi TaxID=7222 RepID=B4JLN0_DROGR|nr:GH24484 [Drosophila grimshawi]